MSDDIHPRDLMFIVLEAFRLA